MSFNRLQQQWVKNSLQEAWALRELPGPGMAGLDHRTQRLRCQLLWRRVFLPSQCTHECHQPRHCTDLGPPYESRVRPQTMLRTNQTECHLGSLLRRQLQCHLEKIQEHGCESLWMSLSGSQLQGLWFCLGFLTSALKHGKQHSAAGRWHSKHLLLVP